MNGMLNIVMVIATIFVAVMTYQVKFKARTLELDIHALRKNSQTLKGDLSVLRAEKAYLSRPERIERLTHRFLRLSPTLPNRVLNHEALLAGRMEVESERSALLALQAMKKKDQERLKADGVNNPAQLSSKVDQDLERSSTHNKISAYAPKSEHKARVMGSIQRNSGSGDANNANQNALALEAVVRPEKKVVKKPVKPKWTYYGGIGDDD